MAGNEDEMLRHSRTNRARNGTYLGRCCELLHKLTEFPINRINFNPKSAGKHANALFIVNLHSVRIRQTNACLTIQTGLMFVLDGWLNTTSRIEGYLLLMFYAFFYLY